MFVSQTLIVIQSPFCNISTENSQLFFLWLLPTLTDFNPDALGSTTRLQIIFDVRPLFWSTLQFTIDTASHRTFTSQISLFSIRPTREKSISVLSLVT